MYHLGNRGTATAMMFCDLLFSVLLGLQLTDIYQKLCKKSAVSFHDLRFCKTGNWLSKKWRKMPA
jgi:hypothetical protein